MAEYFYLIGYTPQAVEQIKLAKKTPRLSNYQAERIEARLTALERVLEDSK